MIERAKLTYSPLGKAFRKQTKTTENKKINKLKLYEIRNLQNNKNQNQLKTYYQKNCKIMKFKKKYIKSKR